MKQEETASFDIINFAYGVGAAIVIIAAMFKFLGWEYSNEFFIVGLTTEAIVFIISAFEYKAKPIKRKNYKWENAFPEIMDETSSTNVNLSKAGERNVASSEALAKSVETFDASIKKLNTTTDVLAQSVQNIQSHIAKTEKTSSEYATQIASLKDNFNTASLGKSIETFDAAIKKLQAATDGLATSAESIKNQLSKTEKSSVDYSGEMVALKENLNKVNAFYKDLLQVMGKKA